MFLHNFHYFSKFEFLGLLGRHQITDQPIGCRATDAKEYCSLLIWILNLIGCQVLDQTFHVCSPRFLGTGKF